MDTIYINKSLAVTPDLDDNVALINEKQKELVEMKDYTNIRWVKGKKHFSILARKTTKIE